MIRSTALLVALGAAPATAELYAERITAENAERRLVGGPDAIGGIGDWALGNGTLCAVVSDPSHESVLSAQGGILIDLAHCGRADDQFNLLQPLLNFSRDDIFSLSEIGAEQAEDAVRIVTRGLQRGLQLETEYALDLARPHRLRVTTRLSRVSPGDSVFLLGDVFLHSNGQLSPFSLSTRNPRGSVGFAHAEIDIASPLSILDAILPADRHVLVGGEELEPGIAYGLVLESARLEHEGQPPERLPIFSVIGEHFTVLGVFAAPFWIGDPDDPGIIELAQALLMDLDPGDTLVYERSLVVGARPDVASVTDRLWADAPRVHGNVDDPAARIAIDTAAGAAATFVRPEADGRFEFRLPAGSYVVRARAPGGRSSERDIVVETADLDLGRIELGPPARVGLPRGAAMRLSFVGQGGTPDPRFGDDFRGFRVGERAIPASTQTRDISLAGQAGDPREVVVAPGRYLVTASRGPEYSATQVRLEVAAGEQHTLEIAAPERLWSAPHWVSADLHVHSALSDDSALPLRARITSFAAGGIDLVVSTEHDRVVDYAPAIARMGLSNDLASIVGVEITGSSHSDAAPHTIGHQNAFPLPLQPLAYRGGAPHSEGVRLRDVIAEVRSLGGERIVQLNHPRGHSGEADDGNLFTHLTLAGEPFDPASPLTSAPNEILVEPDPETGIRDLDFDVVELLNGRSMHKYYRTRADWLSLLLQGEFRPGTANSDSHHLRSPIALPRNYVRVGATGSAPGKVDEAAFVRAVRKGHLYGTTGPLLEVRLGQAGIGNLHTGAQGVLRIAVEAAPWVPVSEARVYVNAERVRTLPIEAGKSVEVELRFAKDAFVTVEVVGDTSEIYEAIAPGFTPFAFTNPIFVDADGDGSYRAPGLPDDLPATITTPLADLAEP